VDVEHVLLGVMKTTGPACDAVLREVGTDAATLYQQAEVVSPRAEATTGTAPHLPYTSAAKQVLQFAVTEARELGHAHIGTEHLLLGLLRSGSEPVAGVLEAAGLRIEIARWSLATATTSQPGPTGEPTARRALLIAVIALLVGLTALALAV
jgi:ATP-dependent Clp protease ATP-binding subunit ClpC